MVVGVNSEPRDVDIVVERVSTDDIQRVFSPYIRRRTRYGGFNLYLGGWIFDIWALEDTWAFRESLVTPSHISRFPKTTFMNIEAVAAQLTSESGMPRRIYSEGFFEALSEQRLEINLQPNPYPALCVVRALVMAARLQYALGPRLAAYIEDHMNGGDIGELLRAQRSHYGHVKVEQQRLVEWLDAISQQLTVCRSCAVTIPVTKTIQLSLWDDPQLAR